MVNIQKAAIIGCGFVGASSAFSLLQKGIFSELVLIDANKEKAEGEAMDISHGRPYAHPMKIYAGSYDDISDHHYSWSKSKTGRDKTGSGTQKCSNFQIDYSGNHKTRI